jgi:hypothetical protein
MLCSGSRANSPSSAAATGKNTGESIFCSDEASHGEAPPRSARLSHPQSRRRACGRSAGQSRSPLGHSRSGQTSRNSGAPALNQSTGYPISSANTRLPRSTGSHSFPSRNLRPHTGRFERHRHSSRQGLMSDFARGVVGVLAVGMIAGVGALLLIPQPSPSAMRFAESGAKPCSQQTWPETDRICQKWTAPQRAGAHTGSGAHGASAEQSPAQADTQPVVQAEPARPARATASRSAAAGRRKN